MSGPARVVAVALLALAAAVTAAWTQGPQDARFPLLGVSLAGVAAVVAAIGRGRVSISVAAAVAMLLGVRTLAIGGHAPDLLGERGGGSATASWVVAAATAAAVASAVWANLRPAQPAQRNRRSAHTRADRQRTSWTPVLALLLLSPIAAEYLAAYNDTTGNAAALLGGLLIFAPLYGAPALLLRELVRRTGRGWPSMLLLAAALGVVQAGLVDQSLFANGYDNVSGWDETLRATYLAPLGIGAYYAQAFVLGHVIYSFCAPIALAEAIRPAAARASWLPPRGIAIAAAGWATAAILILADRLGAAPVERATPPELIGAALVVLALVAAALALRPRPPRVAAITSARVLGATLGASFALATFANIAPETWLGVVVALASMAVGAVLLLRLGRRGGWPLEIPTAVAAGALLSRAALAFTYFPVVGAVSAAPKYAHNAAMLLIAAASGAYAIRRARSAATWGTRSR